MERAKSLHSIVSSRFQEDSKAAGSQHSLDNAPLPSPRPPLKNAKRNHAEKGSQPNRPAVAIEPPAKMSTTSKTKAKATTLASSARSKARSKSELEIEDSENRAFVRQVGTQHD